MARHRFTVDAVGEALTKKQIAQIEEDLKAHFLSVILPNAKKSGQPPFNREQVNCTNHRHAASPGNPCTQCYILLADDNKN